MKRNAILAAIAIIMLAVLFGQWLLLLLISIPLTMLYIKYRESKGLDDVDIPEHDSYDEVFARYGEPDDEIVLCPTRANEISSLILFYHERDLAIVCGKEIKISDMRSVAPKNLAIPYTPDDFAIIINTTDALHPTLHLKVGGDMGLAQEIAAQVASHIGR